MRCAIFGVRLSSARIAPEVRSRALQLQHLAEQHQHGDDRGGLEIDRDRAVVAAELRAAKMSGAHGRERAVGPGHAGAHRDQREHVEVARLQTTGRRARRTASRPTAPPASRRRTGSSSTTAGLTRCRPSRCWPISSRNTGTVSASRDPEPPRHVGQLGIGAAVGGHHVRLERHAADRAASRPDLADLRMHRAGEDRAFRHRLRLAALPPRYFSGSAANLVRQPARAEEIRLAVMGVPVRRGLRIDRHAADGIDHPPADGCRRNGMLRHGRARS